MDRCEWCNLLRELYHNEHSGMALCEDCDKRVDAIVDVAVNKIAVHFGRKFARFFLEEVKDEG